MTAAAFEAVAPAARRRPRFWSLPPVAYFAALAAAPVLVALAGLALTPVFGIGLLLLFASLFGAPSYLIAGGAMFWWTVLRGRISVGHFAAAGFLANLIAGAAAMLILALLTGSHTEAFEISLFIHGFGLVFAPLFGAVFGLVFRALVDRSALPPLAELPELPTLPMETRHA